MKSSRLSEYLFLAFVSGLTASCIYLLVCFVAWTWQPLRLLLWLFGLTVLLAFCHYWWVRAKPIATAIVALESVLEEMKQERQAGADTNPEVN